MKRTLYFCLFCFCFALFGRVPSEAQTSFPMLGATSPVGIKRGTTGIVTVNATGNGGASLTGAYRALFAGKGVTAEVLPPEKPIVIDPKKPWELPVISSIKLKVTVSPDAEMGLREFRIATARAGVSTPGQLFISDEDELTEVEPNDTSEKAQSLPVPCAVSGRIEKNEDVDFYTFKAEAGQEIVFSVLCARLQDKVHDLQEHCDPLLVLRDENGVELGRNDDFYRADPAFSHKFEKAGQYTLQLRDVNYKGNAAWVYRLSVWNRPWVLAASPGAIKAGSSNDLTLSGWNLGGAKTAKLTVPSDTLPGVHLFSLTVNGVSTNPIPLFISDATILQTASPMSFPGGVCLRQTGETRENRLALRMKKGEVLSFEVVAQRIGSTIDAELRLKNAKGEIVASADDTFGKDPGFNFTCPEEQDYSLEVRDISGVGGERREYALFAQSSRPDFTVRCDPNRALIAPGNRTCLFVQIERKNGFDGEVTAQLEGLPPGVTASPVTIPANMTTGTFILTAEAGAKIEATLANVMANATIKGSDGKPFTILHRATPIEEIYMPGGGRGRWEADTLAVGVTEPNDLSVSVDKPTVSLKPGEEVKIEVTIVRREDFKKAVPLDVRVQHFEVFCNPLPPGISIVETTIPEGQNKGTITLKADANAAPIKNLVLPIMGFVSINFVMKTWFVAPVTLTVEKK